MPNINCDKLTQIKVCFFYFYEGILLTRTRDSVHTLVSFTQEEPGLKEIVKAGALVGQSGTDGNAMTENEQKRILQRFKVG